MGQLQVKWWQLTADEVVVLMSTVCLIPYYQWQIRRSNISDLFDKQRFGDPSESTPSIENVRRMGVIVNKITTTLMGQGTCLLRSVILHHLLLRRNVGSAICFGVLPDQTSFAAHAWVEVEGVPVNDVRDIALIYLPFEMGNPAAAFSNQ